MRTSYLLRKMLGEALSLQERQSPSIPPAVEGIECLVECRRCGAMGGDFFDLAAPHRRELLIGMGNIPVKGVAGPILMSGMQATLRSLFARGSEVAAITDELNRIFSNMAPDHAYAGLFSARVDPGSGRIHYINAGHEAALLVRSDGRVERLEPHAPILGLSRRSEYHHRTVRFDAGDTFIVLSEGAGEGAERMLRGTRAPDVLRDLPAKIIDAGNSSVDRTVVMIRRRRLEQYLVPVGFYLPRRPRVAAACAA